MRETTERPEGVEAGAVRLVGTDRETDLDTRSSDCSPIRGAYAAMARAVNPYGDGHAAERATARSARFWDLAPCLRTSSQEHTSPAANRQRRRPEHDTAESGHVTGGEPAYERGVSVIGLGYIGLPTAAVLADHGVRVTASTSTRVWSKPSTAVRCTSSSPISTGRAPAWSAAGVSTATTDLVPGRRLRGRGADAVHGRPRAGPVGTSRARLARSRGL